MNEINRKISAIEDIFPMNCSIGSQAEGAQLRENRKKKSNQFVFSLFMVFYPEAIYNDTNTMRGKHK